jgi:hypothetical protein
VAGGVETANALRLYLHPTILSPPLLACCPFSRSWFVIRRIRGGSKCHKKLFTKLNLRRPSEGACCLVPLNPGSRRYSLSILRRLKGDKATKLVEIKRCGKWPKRIVVTDDVLLADRVVMEGGCIVGGRMLVEII